MRNRSFPPSVVSAAALADTPDKPFCEGACGTDTSHDGRDGLLVQVPDVAFR